MMKTSDFFALRWSIFAGPVTYVAVISNLGNLSMQQFIK